MVGHEAEGVHSKAETASPFLQQEIETAAVYVAEKDRLATVAAENDVVETTGEMNARFSCHADNIAELTNLSTSKPDPRLSLTIACKKYIFEHIFHAYNKRAHMRTTLNIEDSLLDTAAKLTGITEKTSLVRLGLQALIARESAKRLARLAGTEKDLQTIPRRRTEEM